MIFVLLIVLIFILISLHAFPNVSVVQIAQIKEILALAQYQAISENQNVSVEFHHSQLSVNDKQYDLHPLVCEDLKFHYNELGHISQANSLTCFSEKHEYELVFQLGSGWFLVR